MNNHTSVSKANHDEDINGIFFCDEAFICQEIKREDEEQVMQILLSDLSDAKHTFASFPISKKVLALRYMLSQRILTTPYLTEAEKTVLVADYRDAIGSLCSTRNDGITRTIALSSILITRLLYIVEDLSLDEFYQLQELLIPLATGYKVIMDVIHNRLIFHQSHE